MQTWRKKDGTDNIKSGNKEIRLSVLICKNDVLNAFYWSIEGALFLFFVKHP